MGPSDVEGDCPASRDVGQHGSGCEQVPGLLTSPAASQALVEEASQQDRSPEGSDTPQGTADATVHGSESLVKEPQAAVL